MDNNEVRDEVEYTTLRHYLPMPIKDSKKVWTGSMPVAGTTLEKTQWLLQGAYMLNQRKLATKFDVLFNFPSVNNREVTQPVLDMVVNRMTNCVISNCHIFGLIDIRQYDRKEVAVVIGTLNHELQPVFTLANYAFVSVVDAAYPMLNEIRMDLPSVNGTAPTMTNLVSFWAGDTLLAGMTTYRLKSFDEVNNKQMAKGIENKKTTHKWRKKGLLF